MPIHLTPEQINDAMIDLAPAIGKYSQIQSFLVDRDKNILLVDSGDFKTLFNGYYGLRQRPADWYRQFYTIFDLVSTENANFPKVLKLMYDASNRYEASFCSKLVASLNPNKPVIDSIVLTHLGLRLPYSNQENRFAEICNIYEQIELTYAEYLMTDMGRYLVNVFRRNFPDADITHVKMVDFVIWSEGR